MRNDDVEVGKTYAYARHEPTGSAKGTKVTALALEKVESVGRQVTRVRVRYEEDLGSPSGWNIHRHAGTEDHVPARLLWGDWDAIEARADGWASRTAEADRLKTEVIDSLVTLGIVTAEWPRIFGRVGANVGLTVEIQGAAECQAFSDALAFAVAGRG